MTKLDIKRKFEEIVDFADIGDFLDVPVKHYSSGMFVKLGFAIAINCEPHILLIDEVLAVGDKGFQAKCFNKLGQLKRKGLTTILVSHNMHAISTFSDNVLLLKEGEAEYFDKPSEGVKQYSHLFFKSGDDDVEKILSGNEHIDFFDVILNKKVFTPGDSLEILLCYRSSIQYNNVEIDTGIYTNNEIDFYFQATNRTYDKVVDLFAGSYQLRITIKNISINDALATFAIAIWSKNREEKLFWWRIPITFESIDQSTGKNFLRMEYAIEQKE
jgi:lipopolysaccharide transport system ATP-binding protein